MIKDIMSAMLESQRVLQSAIGHNFEDMAPVDRMQYIRDMTLACNDELHEALGETGWKPWATSNHINREEWMGEMADAWLFFMNLMLAGGMTADDLVKKTAEKQDNQYARIKAGSYDGVTNKCPRCKRAYDNEAVKCIPGTCGYSKIWTNVDPAVSCIICGFDYADRLCFPAKPQGFGWCETRKQSFAVDGSIVGA